MFSEVHASFAFSAAAIRAKRVGSFLGVNTFLDKLLIKLVSLLKIVSSRYATTSTPIIPRLRLFVNPPPTVL